MKQTAKRVAAALAIAGALWLYGAIHVVYGEGLGVATCWKHGWSFSDTFVDVDQLKPGSFLPEKVLTATEQCTLTEDPGAWTRDRIILLAALGLALAFGVRVGGKRARSSKGD